MVRVPCANADYQYETIAVERTTVAGALHIFYLAGRRQWWIAAALTIAASVLMLLRAVRSNDLFGFLVSISVIALALGMSCAPFSLRVELRKGELWFRSPFLMFASPKVSLGELECVVESSFFGLGLFRARCFVPLPFGKGLGLRRRHLHGPEIVSRRWYWVRVDNQEALIRALAEGGVSICND